MAYTVDATKFAMAESNLIKGFQELNTQSRALNQINSNFGIGGYLVEAKGYVSSAIAKAKTIKSNEEATLGRLLALNQTFRSEYFSYLTNKDSELNNFVGPKSEQDLLDYKINQRSIYTALYSMYKEANSRGMLDDEGKSWLNYYEKVVAGYNLEDYLLSLEFEDPLYEETTLKYYNNMHDQIKLNPDLTESQKNASYSDIDSQKSLALAYIYYQKEDSRLRKEMAKYEEHDTYSDLLSNGLDNNYNMATYQQLKIDYYNNAKRYYKDILGYSDEELTEIQKQIDAASHFKSAADIRCNTVFDFGGYAKAEEISGKEILGLATPDEIEYKNASPGDRFFSDAKNVAYSWVEGGVKFAENIFDGALSLVSGAGQLVGADTSDLDNFIKTDWSEEGYQFLAKNTGVLDRNSSLHYNTVSFSETITNTAAVVAISCFAPEAAAPLVLAGMGFAHGAGSSYEQALNSGISGGEAFLYAYGNGAIEAAGDALCASKFSSTIIKTQGLNNYIIKSLIPRATYTVLAPVASEGLSVVIDDDFDYKSVIKNEVTSVATFAISEYINANKAYNSKEAKINRLYNGDMEDVSDEDIKNIFTDEDVIKFTLDKSVDENNPEQFYKKTHEVFGENHKDFIDDVISDNEKRLAANELWEELSPEEQEHYTKLYNKYMENPEATFSIPSEEVEFNTAANIIENKDITFKALKDNVLKTYYSSKDKNGFLYNFIKKAKTPALSLPKDSVMDWLLESSE